MNKITDDRFSVARTDSYDLIFEIQFSRLRFMVRSGEQLLWLEDHFLGNSNDVATLVTKCTALLDHHSFLNTRFWKSVKLVSDLQVHTLIPAADFDASKAEEYLMLTYPTARLTDFEISYDPVLNQQVVTGTLRQLNSIFRNYYPGLQVVSSIAATAGYFSRMAPEQTLGVISDRFIELFYLNGKNKTLRAEKTAVKNIRNTKITTSVLVVFGEVTPFSTSYGLLKEKFETVTIGQLPHPAGINLREFPEHRYFRLLNT